MAKRASQSDHDKIVQYAANFLTTNHYRNIKADIPGYQTPTKIIWKDSGRGHIPDVTANGSEFNLFEVETADSINDQHTKDQWTLFATYAEQHNAVFWVVVPQGSGNAAKLRLSLLGLKGEVWEIKLSPAFRQSTRV